MGKGSMTGRRAGPCAGDAAQGAPGQGSGRGFGRGLGRRFGKGGGAGFGKGWQWWRRGGEEEALRMRLDALKEEMACLERGVRGLKGDADKA
jgi:hypothetical protein